MSNHKENDLIEAALQRLGKDLAEDAFRRREQAQPHNTREQAAFLLEQFFERSPDELSSLVVPLTSKVFYEQGVDGYVPGRLADEPFRSLKNLYIAELIVLSTELQNRFPTEYEIITTLGDACVREVERATTDEELQASMQASIMMMKKHTLGKGNTSFYHPLVKQAKDFIFQHLHERIELKDLAKKLGTSQSYLSQLFRKYEGMTPQQFILKERLSRAKSQLVYSDRSIEEISFSLGFSSTSYFGKCLKQETGLTPLQYREKFSAQYRNKLK